MKERKHEAPPRYDAAFKEGAIRLVAEEGRPIQNTKPTVFRARNASSHKKSQLDQKKLLLTILMMKNAVIVFDHFPRRDIGFAANQHCLFHTEATAFFQR